MAGFSDTAPFSLPSQTDMSSASFGGGGFDLSGLSTGLNIFGTGLQAFGQWEQGQEIAGAYEYNAAIALQSNAYEVSRIDVAEKEMGGTQQAMYARAGVTMSGSPLDVMLKSASNFELEKQVATYNAQSKANMYQYEAKQAKQKAAFDATGTLISGVEKIAQTAGMFAMLA